MKHLSLAEFKDYCLTKGFSSYVYDSENQMSDIRFSSPGIIGYFTDLEFFFHPNIILLKNDTDTMFFRHVQDISLSGDGRSIGEKVFINCKPIYNNEPHSFCLIAQ